MVIGREVAVDKTPLFPVGTVIKPSTVNLLRQRSVKKVWVIDAPDVTADQKRQVFATVRDAVESSTGTILDRLRRGISVPRETIDRTVDGILEVVSGDPRALVNLHHTAGDESYLYSHSINTAVLATIFGRRIGWSEERVVACATGALLHDAGMLAVPAHILTKKGKLDFEEWAFVMHHPEYGMNEAARIPAIPPVAISVIWQHQERLDGSGYPEGLRGRDICDEARLVSICDIYEALSSFRPYRDAAIEHDALKKMAAEASIKLDGDLLQEFLKVVPIYPVGSSVVLSNGQAGIVIGSSGNPFRPVVEVGGFQGKTVKSEVDLSNPKFYRLYIQGIVPARGGEPPSAG